MFTDTAIAELIQERITKGIFWPALQMEQEFLKGLDTDKVNPFVEQCIAQKESLNTVSLTLCSLIIKKYSFICVLTM